MRLPSPLPSRRPESSGKLHMQVTGAAPVLVRARLQMLLSASGPRLTPTLARNGAATSSQSYSTVRVRASPEPPRANRGVPAWNGEKTLSEMAAASVAACGDSRSDPVISNSPVKS